MQNEQETRDLVPCVYVRFPPRPVARDRADEMEFCFRNPITLALYGYAQGYRAPACRMPPRKICREFDWFQARRKMEEDDEWAWTDGPNIFRGSGTQKHGEECNLDSDCQDFPKNLCFGSDAATSVCDSGVGIDLGNACNFDRQCQINAEKDTCDNAVNTELCPDMEFERICQNYICVIRTNCREYHCVCEALRK